MKLFFERYIKLAHIGKGANAHVYKVRHAELGYVRAIKILNEYIESTEERACQSFLKECKTLLAIGNGAHPNIIRIYGPDLIDNRAIVEMDYVEGMTLDSYIKDKGFLGYEEVKTFIHDIVGALAYTHHDIYKFLMNPEEDDLQPDPNDGKKYVITPEKEAELVKKYGIAHNDLHSNNVMRRDYDGRFVLLDFGLAVQDGKCIKSSRMADGNPEYQAPEKFDSETVDPRSDVYSLGILMYEMLAGKVPFEVQYDSEGKTSYRSIKEVLNQHLTMLPPPIIAFRKVAFEKNNPGKVYERDYPEWLDEIIMKCLSKIPEDRFKNAKELLENINSCYVSEYHNSHELTELNEKRDNFHKEYQCSIPPLFNKDWQDAGNELNKYKDRLDKEIRERGKLMTELEQLRLDNKASTRGKSVTKTFTLIILSVFSLCTLVWALYLDSSYDRLKHRFYNAYENAVNSNAYDPKTGYWFYATQTDTLTQDFTTNGVREWNDFSSPKFVNTDGKKVVEAYDVPTYH